MPFVPSLSLLAIVFLIGVLLTWTSLYLGILCVVAVLSPLLYGLIRFIENRNLLCRGTLGVAEITKIEVRTMVSYGQVDYNIYLLVEAGNGKTHECKTVVNAQIVKPFFDILDFHESPTRVDVIYLPDKKIAMLPLALIYYSKYVLSKT